MNALRSRCSLALRCAALAAERDPVDQQQPAGGLPRSSASSLREPLAAVPSGFTVQTPPRIAIDLPGVTNAIGQVQRRDQPGQPALGERRPVG